MRIHPEVADALTAGRPVVALESTIISHGLPRPDNLRIARAIEHAVRAGGAVPATIAIIDGQPHIGLDDDALHRIAIGGTAIKVSVREIAMLAAVAGDGATTVAATAHLAAAAGITVFATGGLGGVHRGARDSYDESADLTTLSRTPVLVVCSGVKSILDIGATLERLETLSVGVIGYRTDRFGVLPRRLRLPARLVGPDPETGCRGAARSRPAGNRWLRAGAGQCAVGRRDRRGLLGPLSPAVTPAQRVEGYRDTDAVFGQRPR